MNEYFDLEYRDLFGEDESQTPFSRRIWVSWEDLKFKVPKHRGFPGISSPNTYEEKLTGVWGGAGPGEIVAILGEILSGKSLILKILAGILEMKRGDLLSGTVLVNGFKRGQSWRRLCSLVSHSNRDYHGLLTVEEQLQFRSRLALPRNWNHVKRRKVVDWVLESLELEEIKSRKVESLTICEWKRLSIGLSLVGLPRVLLLDEPTEGLDPTRALELMKIIKKITYKRQMTTIISAKQLRNSSMSFIDRILLLSQGSTLFYGKFTDGIEYFKTRMSVYMPETGDCPLFCILDAINCYDCRRDPTFIPRIRREWDDYASQNQLYRMNYPNVTFDDNNYYKWNRSWFTEFKEQSVRSFLLFYRNTTHWIGQTFLALVLALIIAFSAFQVDKDEYSAKSKLTVLYFTTVFFQFFPFIPFLFVCHRDMLVLRRERRDSLVRVGPSYLAGWAIIYSFRFLIVTLYTCIVYFIVGLRLPFNYTLVFWLTLLAEAWVAMGMGYIIITLIQNLAIADTVGSFILLLCIWFSGEFVYNPNTTWILRWLAYLSPIFYSLNALANNEFDGTGQIGEEIIKKDKFTNYGLWPSIGTLLGFGLFYMIVGYFALMISTRPNRKYI